jgi:MoaA/NifB/PqqE/SkfB family radical SAM enzyme
VDGRLSSKAPLLGTLAFLYRWLSTELLSKHNGQWVLNSFCPPFPGRAFDRAFENLLSKRRFSPISAFLAVTSQCPYHCWHCSLARRDPGALSTEQWLSTIDQLHGLGASIIGFTGGEPAMRVDLPELVSAAHDGGAAPILFTSGVGVDRSLASRLQESGLWSMCVSLDTSDPREYDRMRGKEGAFDQALEALRIAKAFGFYTMIGAVATRSFVETREFENVRAVGVREGVDEMRIIEPMPCGKLAGQREDYLLTTAHTETLREFHRKTNRRGKLPKVCSFNQIESPEVFGCAGGIQHMFIDPAGRVCPCDFTPLTFGTVAQEPLEHIWERMNTAMGRPRRRCIVQQHYKLFEPYLDAGYPVPMERSVEIARSIPAEPLPAYYRMVMAGDPRYEKTDP